MAMKQGRARSAAWCGDHALPKTYFFVYFALLARNYLPLCAIMFSAVKFGPFNFASSALNSFFVFACRSASWSSPLSSLPSSAFCAWQSLFATPTLRHAPSFVTFHRKQQVSSLANGVT